MNEAARIDDVVQELSGKDHCAESELSARLHAGPGGGRST